MAARVLRSLLYATLTYGISCGFVAAQAQPAATRHATSKAVALYAAVGAELTYYEVAVDTAVLTKRDSVKLPAAVQYAWPHPSNRYLYVVWSEGQGSGQSVHGVSAFDVEPGSGSLHLKGQPIFLKNRPIHVTTDRDGTHLLIVYNAPAAVTVYNISPDGAIGTEVKQSQDLDLGIYVHQVRVEPSNQAVIVVARGNYEHRQDPGALKIFNYKDGVLTNRVSITPGDGANFNPRHLDFAKSMPLIFVTLEAQNKLQVYRFSKYGTPSKAPLFSKDTLAEPSNVPTEHRQLTGTVHVHPSGQFVYTANRATGTVEFQGKQIWAGGEDSISVFRIDATTGEPKLIQNADTKGFIPRTFALDPSGQILIAANQSQRFVRHGEALTSVPSSLAIFRVHPDGTLSFVRTYEMSEANHGNLFWMGIMPIPSSATGSSSR